MVYTMKNTLLFLIIVLIVTIHTACGSLNKAQGEFHYNNNVTKGQELLDLKNALDKEAIDQDEYDLMKNKIINDEYIKSFFRELERMEEEDFDSVRI